MRHVKHFFGGLWIQALNPLMAMVLVFAVVVGMAEHVAAQTSRYTLDDVIDKLIEMDKRLSVVETEVKRNRELIETVNTNLSKQIETANTNLSKQIETANANLSKQIETVNTNLGSRISDTNTTMFWLFGFLGTLFLGILALTFATYRNTASLVKLPEGRRAPEEIEGLQTLQEEVKGLAERQSELERKLTTAKLI